MPLFVIFLDELNESPIPIHKNLSTEFVSTSKAKIIMGGSKIHEEINHLCIHQLPKCNNLEVVQEIFQIIYWGGNNKDNKVIFGIHLPKPTILTFC